MKDINKQLDELLEEVREYYKTLLNFPKKSLGDQEVLKNLPREVGVYVIYKPNGGCLYVGEAVDIRVRLKELMRFDHTLSKRLLKKEIGKSLNIDTNYTFKRKFQEKTGFDWYINQNNVWEKFKAERKNVEGFLKKCFFRYLEIKGENRRGKAKLLERLVQVRLKPEIKDYRED